MSTFIRHPMNSYTHAEVMDIIHTCKESVLEQAKQEVTLLVAENRGLCWEINDKNKRIEELEEAMMKINLIINK